VSTDPVISIAKAARPMIASAFGICWTMVSLKSVRNAADPVTVGRAQMRTSSWQAGRLGHQPRLR